MRRPFIAEASVLAGLLLAFSGSVQAQSKAYVLDPEHLVVAFLVDHAGFAKVLGRFTSVQGEFEFDAEARTLGSGEVRIGANSVASDDRGRDRHLRGSDFFNVRSHSSIVFRAGELRLGADGSGELDGEIEILGVARPITLQARMNQEADSPFNDDVVLGGSLRGSLMRSDFGMDYGLDRGWVGDEVELIIEFEAIRQD